MKYLYQAGIIFLFTFLGEVLTRLIPFPIPAAVWGLLLLFVALCLGWVKPGQIGECGHFLTVLLPLLFVAPTVNLMDQAAPLLDSLPAVAAIMVTATLLTFLVSGRTTQFFLKRFGKEGHE